MIRATWNWINTHAGAAALLGGFSSMTLGAAYWLAKGGAVAFVTSINALADEDVAQALAQLPEYQQERKAAIEELTVAVRQIGDALEAYRVETEAVVDWAPEHSQRLTDAVGGCYAGQAECLVYFRGRRTQSGAACELQAGRPRIILADGREFPVQFSQGFEMEALTTEFRTMEVRLQIPEHIPPGIAGVVVVTLYAKCPFASSGEIVERETFRLMVEIKPGG